MLTIESVFFNTYILLGWWVWPHINGASAGSEAGSSYKGNLKTQSREIEPVEDELTGKGIRQVG